MSALVAQLGALAGPEVYDCHEHGLVAIPHQRLIRNGAIDIYPSVAASGYLTVRSDKGNLVFQAGGFVGLIPINDSVSINVRPRVPIGNLQRMLDISQQLPVRLAGHLHRYEERQALLDSWADLLTDAFLAATSRLRLRGFYKTYTAIERRSLHPRGRILLGKTARLRAKPAATLAVAVKAFERTIDNPANQCLKAAALVLLRLYSNQRKSKRLEQVRKLLHALEPVTESPATSFLAAQLVQHPERFAEWHSAYVDAITLAKAIIRGAGIDIRAISGPLSLQAIVLDMAILFENYVRNVLRGGLGPVAEVRDGNLAMWSKPLLTRPDGRPGTKATPDIVLAKAQRTIGVSDCKYKPFAGDPPREDMNQIIVYSTVYGTDRMVLVHPAADVASRGARMLGWVEGRAVFRYGLSLQSHDLTQEENAMVQWFQAFCRSSTRPELAALAP